MEFPRHSVMWGSTNSDRYLHDETGARRFLPIRCTNIDIVALERDRDQLWAEAKHLMQAGEPWWFEDEVVKAAAEEEQRARFATDPWEAKVIKLVEHSAADGTSIDDVLHALGIPDGRKSQVHANRIARIFKKLGLNRYQKRSGKDRDWRYR
jgi:predicted P-loop ATPase